MNELIERLARESGVWPSLEIIRSGVSYVWPRPDERTVERFAALVAQECARLAAVCRAPTNEREEGYSAACKECADMIRAAFPLPP